MRLLQEEKIIFLSNPKTGSTSIRSFLDKEYFRIIKSNQFFPFYHHTSAVELKYYFLKNDHVDWSKFTSFCFVRNPWERAISNFLYAKPDKNFYPFYNLKYDKSTQFSKSFTSWLKFVLKNSLYNISSYNLTDDYSSIPFVLNAYHLLIPIKWFAFDLDGKQLVENIFKLEDLHNEVVPFLKSKLNKKEVQILKQNSSPISNNLDLRYDLNSIELIQDNFTFEITNFSYKFNLEYKKTFFNLFR